MRRPIAAALTAAALAATVAGCAPSSTGATAHGVGARLEHADSVAVGLTSTTSAAKLYKLNYFSLPENRKMVMRWDPCSAITYKVNLAAVPKAKRSYALALTQQAFRKVGQSTGMVFTYRGLTAELPTLKSNKDKQSAEIILAWTTPKATTYKLAGATAGYGGSSGYWWWTGDGKTKKYFAALTRGYVVIDTPDALNPRTLRQGFTAGASNGNLLLHEISHATGLAHVNAATQLMNPYLTSKTPNGFGAGDRAGLSVIGRKAGCNPVPSWVAKDLK